MKKYIFFQFSGVLFQQIKWNVLWFHCTMKIWPFICGNMKKIRWTRGFFCFIWRICPYVVTSREIEQGTENVQRQLLHSQHFRRDLWVMANSLWEEAYWNFKLAQFMINACICSNSTSSNWEYKDSIQKVLIFSV